MTSRKLLRLSGVALVALCLADAPALAQNAVDRSDPAVAEHALSVPRDLPRTLPQPTRVSAPPSGASTVGDTLAVGAVLVEGARTVPIGDFSPVIERYLGRTLGPSDLRALAQEVANVARVRGYVFASAWIPEQALAAGVLRVRLDEGIIHDVRITGGSDPAVGRRLLRLADGRPVTKAGLERALLLAGDLPGVRVAETRYQREGGRGVLVVRTAEQRVVGNVQIDNWGSDAVGPIRLRARTDFNGVLGGGDQLSVRGTVTPLDPRELATLGFDYAADTGANGLLAGVGASYTRVQPGGRPASDRVEGRSVSLNANLSYPVLRSLDANLWATADFTLRDVEQDRAGTRSRDDRFALMTLGVSGYRSFARGWAYARASVRQGLPAFDATRRGDPFASRSGGSARFTKLDIYADWAGPISGPWGLRVAAEGQVSTRALLSSEEMGIGGPRFGRGYDYSELSGDRGIAGLAELRYDVKGLPIRGRTTQLYAFADAGTVGNIGRGGRGGSLYSAGGGARFDLSKVLDAGAEIAFPLGRDRYETGNRNPRLSLTLSARF